MPASMQLEGASSRTRLKLVSAVSRVRCHLESVPKASSGLFRTMSLELEALAVWDSDCHQLSMLPL